MPSGGRFFVAQFNFMSAQTTLNTFLHETNLDISMETLDVGALLDFDLNQWDGFNAPSCVRTVDVSTQTVEGKPCKLCRRYKRKLKLFRGIYSRLEAFEDGDVVPEHIVVGAEVNVFWPATEEISPAVILAVNYSACAVHVKWPGENGFETEDLSMSWILPK